MINFFKLLIKNNTGVSMKNFILFLGGILAFISIISFIVLLYLDFFYTDKTLSINLLTYASVITAIEGILGLLFYLKVKSEKNEISNYDMYKDVDV